MYKIHSHCRACGFASTGAQGIKSGPSTDKLLPVFDLGLQPLANDFAGLGDERAGYAPLSVLLCPRCHLAQLSATVDPKILYARNYPYVTSPSETMKEHFGQIRFDIEKESQGAGNRLLEIGSNDGLMLEYFQHHGWKVLGIDPAPNLCVAATDRGVETANAFFGKESAESLAMMIKPDVIIARHVFCHCDDWHDFIAGLELLASKNTLICIETPYVQNLLDKGEFDTIYHEHLSYLSLKAVVKLLEGTTLYLHNVIHYSIHGGAVMLMLRRIDYEGEPSPSVENFLAEENVGPEKWAKFSEKASGLISTFKSQVMGLIQSGKTVAGLGASAKSTVFLNACRMGRESIKFIADSTQGKLYKTSPGTEIPIVDEGAILRELPDYVVAFCWNYRSEILHRNLPAMKKGVRFIFPVPQFEIV